MSTSPEDKRRQACEAMARYRQRHPGKAEARAVQWRKEHLERAREIDRQWYTRNRERKIKRHRDNRAGARKSVYGWIHRNPEKHRAHRRVEYAIASGKLMKSLFCQMCLTASKLEAHHEDYAIPLEVVWLCRMCHRGLSRKGGKSC